MDRAGSIEKDDLDKAFTLPEACTCVKNTIQLLNDCNHEIRVPSLSSMNKSLVLKKLIEYRKLYFEGQPEEKSRLEDEAKRLFLEQYPEVSLEQRIDVSESRLYCLSEEVLELERYKSVRGK